MFHVKHRQPRGLAPGVEAKVSCCSSGRSHKGCRQLRRHLPLSPRLRSPGFRDRALPGCFRAKVPGATGAH